MGNKKSKEILDEETYDEDKADKAMPITIEANRLRAFTPNETIPGQGMEALELLKDKLCLEASVINKFYSLFCIADEDRSGEIDFDEFFRFLDIRRTPFNEKLFGLFDFDGNENIDLIEFVCAIWNLCTWRKSQLSRLMFALYAPNFDVVRWLDLRVVKQMLKDIYASRKNTITLNLLLDSIELISIPGVLPGEERVLLADFKEWCKEYDKSTQPIEAMQRFLRNRILGWNWWVTVGAETRERILEQMEVHNRELFGESGAVESMEQAINVAAEKRKRKQKEKERMKSRQEAVFQARRQAGEVFDEKEELANLKKERRQRRKRERELLAASGDADLLNVSDSESDEEESANSKLNTKMIESRDRVQAYRAMVAQRRKKAKEWNELHKRIMGDRDPFNVMVQCQAPWMLRAIRKELDEEWDAAEAQMRRETYAPPTLKGIANHDVYFQRKSALEVPVFLQAADPVFSVAHGERSYELEQIRRRRQQNPNVADIEQIKMEHAESQRRARGTPGSVTSEVERKQHRASSRNRKVTNMTGTERAMMTDPAWFRLPPLPAPAQRAGHTPMSTILATSPRSRPGTGFSSLAGESGKGVGINYFVPVDPRGAKLAFAGKYKGQNHKMISNEYHKEMLYIKKKMEQRLRAVGVCELRVVE